MKALRLVLVLLSLVPVLSCAGGSGSSHADLEARIQSMVEEEFQNYASQWVDWKGGLAMLVTASSDQYFSATNFDGPVDQYTHFRGASTTKTFTASAILLLQQQGLLDIDDYITDIAPGTGDPYVPDDAAYGIPYKSQITIRQLLGHRAGVFDVTNDPIPETSDMPYKGQNYVDYVRQTESDDHTFTFDELVNVVAVNQLSYFAPGGGYHYSNTGYNILGKIVERLSGLSWGEFVVQNLTEPNHLDETSFPYLGYDVTIPSPYADGYTWWEGQTYATTEDNMSANVAEGNVISTLDDLTNWIKRLLTAQAGLNAESIAMMTDVQPTGESHGNYGLGCTYTEGLGYGHNGGHVGFLTVMRYDPDYDVSVVLFMSDINLQNLYDQLNFMYDVGRSAREILGYPSETGE